MSPIKDKRQGPSGHRLEFPTRRGTCSPTCVPQPFRFNLSRPGRNLDAPFYREPEPFEPGDARDVAVVEILSRGLCCGYRERVRRRWSSHCHRHPTRSSLSSLPIDHFNSHWHSDALADEGGGHLAWSLNYWRWIWMQSLSMLFSMMSSDLCTTSCPPAANRQWCPGALRRRRTA